MSVETEVIAQKLKANATANGYMPDHYPEIDGVPYTFPCQDIEGESFDAWLPPEVIDTYSAMKDLMEGPLPQSWRDFMKEAYKKAQLNGVSFPVDLMCSAFFTMVESPDRLKELGIEPFKEVEEFGPDFTNKDEVFKRVDACINDPILRPKMLGIASRLIPDCSTGPLDLEIIASIINKNPGVVLDVGCGIGSRTNLKRRLMPKCKIIGADRQYHPRWYNENWVEEGEGKFVRSDARALPFAEGSVDYATIEFVAEHITKEGMEEVLGEVKRVLKPGGILFIGPQSGELSCFGWVGYRKNENSDSIEEFEVGSLLHREMV